jgi:hypothetical protein
MPRPVRLLAAAAVLLLVAGAAPAADPPDLTLPYPAKAPLVLHVHGIGRTKDRLTKMLAALPPDDARALNRHLDAAMKAALAGRKLSAVPPDGRTFVVFHDLGKLSDEIPPISVLVPVTGYREFRETFLTDDERKSFQVGADRVDSVKSVAGGGEVTVFLVDLKDYVALTLERAAADDYAGKYERARSGAMGPDLAASFLEADVSLYANMALINEAHREDIRNLKALLEFSLQQAQMNDLLPGFDKRQLELAKQAVGGFFQGVEDCRGAVLAAEFRPAGLNVRFQAHFADDSPTARLLKSEAPTPLADLGRLPGGMGGYSASRFGPKTGPLVRSFGTAFQGAPEDAGGAARVEKFEAEIAAAGPGTELAATSPDAALGVTEYARPAMAAAAERTLYQELGKGARVGGVVLREPPRVTEAAQKHRGFTLAEVKLVFDFEATVAALPENARGPALAILKRTAREKTVTWLGTDGKVVVRATARDWPAARKLLDAYLDGTAGVGGEAGFQLTRKNLPADATAIRLFETREAVLAVLDYYREMAKGLPGDLPPIGPVKSVPGEPTYVGLALTLRPQAVTVDLFVPGAAMNVAARMLGPLFRNIE